MATNVESAPQPVFRLPWPAAGASLSAFAALFITEGGSLALPVLALGLIASYLSSYRLGDQRMQYGPVILFLFALVFAGFFVHPPNGGEALFDSQRTALFGELCAALLVMECWRQRPDAGGRGVIVILLSGLILWSATNTYEDRFTRFFVPVYAVFLLLSLRGFGEPSEPRRIETEPSFVRSWRAVVFLLAMGIGVGGYLLFHDYRSELTEWGMRLLNEVPHSPMETTGMSRTPTLGATYGLKGTLERVLRVEGNVSAAHLRGVAFNVYSRGHWGPTRENRKYTPISLPPFEGAQTVKTERLRILRLVDNDGILFAPLHAAGLDLAESGEVEWAKEEGGPLHTSLRAPSDYTVRVTSNESYQGPLCQPPTPVERRQLLSVPSEIDPRVRALAQRVAGSRAGLLEKARAIESDLMSHHSYSLVYRPGPGDPVSSFVLGAKAAHCEYFASAAVILLRCAGIPARYVIGYYAHETVGPGVTIVRQRDAHAWAEAWIEGVGWITVDATPGDGRPDLAGEAVPFWKKAMEWLQDRFAALSASADEMSRTRALLFLAVPIPAALILWWFKRRRALQAAAKPFAYASPSEELAALGARFEALCRRKERLCPPGRTWQEFFATTAAISEEPAARLDRDQVLAFVRTYNALRFGAADSGALADLRSQLEALER